MSQSVLAGIQQRLGGTKTYTAAEAISSGQLVSLDVNNQAIVGDCSDLTRLAVVGFALIDAVAGGQMIVVDNGSIITATNSSTTFDAEQTSGFLGTAGQVAKYQDLTSGDDSMIRIGFSYTTNTEILIDIIDMEQLKS